ncbi:MAG: aminoglycoside 6'-N-acetyltransferase, partial [Sphingorhabdus sp.]
CRETRFRGDDDDGQDRSCGNRGCRAGGLMPIVAAAHDHLGPWSEMRHALWTWDTVADHAEQASAMYLASHPDRQAFIALDDDGKAVGFAEAILRRDYVEGCVTSPVVFLEGIYIRPEARLVGFARALADAVGQWGETRGCSEFASNALLDNIDSHSFHAAIGFEETERVVYFRKTLA